MTQPSVKHLTGRHLTASDKRTIIDGIEYMRREMAKGTNPSFLDWISRKGSRKEYKIDPCTGEHHVYRVFIAERERDSMGRMQNRSTEHTVRLSGVEQLPAIDRDPEGELRAMWTAEGVPQERQDQLIHQVTSQAKAGIYFEPTQMQLPL